MPISQYWPVVPNQRLAMTIEISVPALKGSTMEGLLASFFKATWKMIKCLKTLDLTDCIWYNVESKITFFARDEFAFIMNAGNL